MASADLMHSSFFSPYEAKTHIYQLRPPALVPKSRFVLPRRWTAAPGESRDERRQPTRNILQKWNIFNDYKWFLSYLGRGSWVYLTFFRIWNDRLVRLNTYCIMSIRSRFPQSRRDMIVFHVDFMVRFYFNIHPNSVQLVIARPQR